MRLILVRHGDTEWNTAGVIQGHNPTPLSQLGRNQAKAVAKALATETLAGLFSSSLNRAVETARMIAEPHGIAVRELDGLREVDAGHLVGLTSKEYSERFPEFASQWRTDAAFTRMPGGESIDELRERGWEAILGIFEKHPTGTVVAVSHNFTIQTILCSALHIPIANFRSLRHNTASYSILEMREAFCAIELLNETCHLQDLALNP
jgi:broad specificity phosphatase PhoE